jgi:hypothetical protein
VRIKASAALLAALALAVAPAARAQTTQLRDFCAERPGRATPPCIIDPGHVMLEVDVFDVTRDRTGGVTTQATVAFSPHLRVGLTDTVEAGITFVPYTEVRTRGDPTAASKVRGTGDTEINLKISLMNPSGDGPSVAILPFIMAPTAQHGLGAGGFQGGVIVPVALALPAGFTLTVDPEVDALRDGQGGVRPAYVMAASLSHAVFPGGTLGVELWSSAAHLADGAQRQATADVILAWIPPRRPNLQLDTGVNVGLTRDTPDVQAYVGVSRRF